MDSLVLGLAHAAEKCEGCWRWHRVWLASGGDAVREQRARLQKRGRKRRGRDMGHEVADACRFVPQ